MRKIILFISAMAVAFTFCGCTLSESFYPLSYEYLVSALGFDQNGNEKTVIMEAVVINSEDADAEKQTKLLTGTGKTLNEALKNADKKAVMSAEFSHCAVAVIGDGVREEYFDEICKYIYSKKEITIALGFVSTQNAEELLSQETVSSVAVGYDIVSMLQTYAKKNETAFTNRFYEIKSKRSNNSSFSLPFFKVEADGYFIDGNKEFKNGRLKRETEENALEVVAK